MSILKNIIFLMLFSLPLYAQEPTKIDDEIPIRGKFEAGPAYVHIDILKSGRTVHTMDLAAIKADFNYRPFDWWECFTFKTSVLLGHGRDVNQMANVGFGIGNYLPLCKGFYILPYGGITWGYVKTPLHMRTPLPHVKIHLEEKFYSTSPYLALEAGYTFFPGWRLVGSVQYSWSRTKTKIKDIIDETSHSEGWSYYGMLEHDLNDHWSVNVGGGYNSSLSKEKHGLRAYGFKLGIAHWF